MNTTEEAQSTEDHPPKCFKVRLTFISFLLYGLILALLIPGLNRLSVQKREFRAHLQQQQAQMAELQSSLKDIQQRYALLSLIRQRARGVDESEYLCILEAIEEAEKKYNIGTVTLLAIIQVESTFSNYAVSPKGAIGLMQILPETGQFLCDKLDLNWEGPHSLFDPCLNIRLGSYYLARLNEHFNDFNLALEAYNKGPARVRTQLISGTQVEGVYSSNINLQSSEFTSEMGII